MKTISKILFLILVAASFCSCDEPAGPAFVYGSISIGPGDTADFHGSLSNSGAAEVYGSCKVENGVLQFTVGDASEADIDGIVGVNNPTFLSVAGIVGPNGAPVNGVFDLDNSENDEYKPKNNSDDYSTFTRAHVKNDIDTWKFVADSSNCKVELFAVPIEGEVIFEDGLSKSFDYYVRLNCSNMSLPGQKSETLRTLYAELYFENCS